MREIQNFLFRSPAIFTPTFEVIEMKEFLEIFSSIIKYYTFIPFFADESISFILLRAHQFLLEWNRTSMPKSHRKICSWKISSFTKKIVFLEKRLQNRKGKLFQAKISAKFPSNFSIWWWLANITDLDQHERKQTHWETSSNLLFCDKESINSRATSCYYIVFSLFEYIFLWLKNDSP